MFKTKESKRHLLTALRNALIAQLVEQLTKLNVAGKAYPVNAKTIKREYQRVGGSNPSRGSNHSEPSMTKSKGLQILRGETLMQTLKWQIV